MYVLCYLLYRLFFSTNSLAFRVLKTPTEDIWPGVTNLPDYKATFPNWTNYTLEHHVANLDDDGIDLLKSMLVYDPKQRISAKRVVPHKYFHGLDRTVTPNL